MTDTHLPPNWIQKEMVLLGIPGWISGHWYHQIVRFFTAWAIAEGGTADWDPLNTTEHVSDSWGPWQGKDYNSTGVANYTTSFHGVCATAATLLESAIFIDLVKELRHAEANDLSAELIVSRQRPAIHAWGTSPDLMLAILRNTP